MTSAANLRWVFKRRRTGFLYRAHVLLVERGFLSWVCGWDTHPLGSPSTHSFAIAPLLRPAGGAEGFCRRLVPAQTPSPEGVTAPSHGFGRETRLQPICRADVKSVHAFPSSGESEPEVSTLALKKETETRFALHVIIPQASSSILDNPSQKRGFCH